VTMIAAAAAGLVERFIDHVRDHEPVEATRLGLTERDSDLPELTTAALSAASDSLAELEVAARLMLASIPGSATGPEREARGDLSLLCDAVAWRRVELEQRPSLAEDPLVALGLITAGIRTLLAPSAAGPEERQRRTAAAIARARQVPALLEQAGRLLTRVSAPAFDVALQRVPGLITLVRDALPQAAIATSLDVDAARDAGEFAAEGLEAFAALLDELVDDRRADWRVGPVHHESALRLAVGTQMDAQSIEDRARIALVERRAQMVELAAADWRRRFPGERRPSDDAEILQRSFASIAGKAVGPAQLMGEARRALDEAREFTLRWGLTDVPPIDALRLEPMPPELRGSAVALVTRPAPLRADADSVYYLMPVSETWDSARQRSFLSEYHPAQLRSLAVHEGYPGHFLQLSHAARHPRVARRLLARSVFAEGWAVMMERIVLEAGFGLNGTSRIDRADLELTQLRMEVGIAADALLDIGLHAASMTDADALALLTGAALQQEPEAQAKLLRAKVTCGQLTAYFAGAEELTAVRRAQEARLGSAFDLGHFLRCLLSHGTPTVDIAAEALAEGAPEVRPFAAAA
jgi:hypothetical protein